MKKFITSLLVFGVATFSGCSPISAEKYFDVAILNSNLLVDFASEGLLRQLQSPSVKLSEDGKQVSMTRSEVIETKIEVIESNFENLKSLSATEETRDILNASRALYELVLPVYQNEYRELAKLYDENAPAEEIQRKARIIQDKYAADFEELHTKLMRLGKPYAEKNKIDVKWGIQTSPSL